jgi:hypothetical protein
MSDTFELHVGKAAASRSITRIATLRGSPGWIVESGVVREWRFEGFTERDGELYIFGPSVPGKTLQSVLSLGFEQALPFISIFVESLVLLTTKGIPAFSIHSDCVLFTDSGGVFFAPPEVLRELRALRPYEESRDTFEALNHPDLKGESLVSFSIGALLYRISTGRFPFAGATSEEIHEEARKREVANPHGLVPELSEEFSTAVMTALSGQRGAKGSLERWRARLSQWRDAPPIRELSEGEKEKILRESKSKESRSHKIFRFRVFWERNWRLLAIIAGAAAIAGIVIGSILSGIFAPRPTHLFSPQKVVETFYLSMNSLDHTTMGACVVEGAGSAEISATTNIYVISRVSYGYQGKSTVTNPADWDAQGRPKLTPPTTLFGVTSFHVTQEQGEPSPVYLVSYERWMPAQTTEGITSPTDAPASGPTFSGANITDRVHLKKDREDWVIYKIDRIEETAIDVSKWK